VKCGEELEGCHNCQRVGINCPGYPSGSAHAGDARTAVNEIFEAAGITKREFGACQECRTTKNRCTKERPKCQRCQNKQQPCTYDSSNLRRPQRSRAGPKADEELTLATEAQDQWYVTLLMLQS
jgi:Fungal Zn(2)-Cys(6) binuclear cluster domain